MRPGARLRRHLGLGACGPSSAAPLPSAADGEDNFPLSAFAIRRRGTGTPRSSAGRRARYPRARSECVRKGRSVDISERNEKAG
mmetsp:Transcript_10126/g.29940  ORF Transcript_10126/g.29940 Transcript_10126/m.29940 type:complete len:84 (-) Transcript_10126:174-425(-)